MTLSELIKGGKSAFFAVKEEIANDEFAVEINQALPFEWGVESWVPHQFITGTAFYFGRSFAMKLPVSKPPMARMAWIRLATSQQVAGLTTYLGVAPLDQVGDTTEFLSEKPTAAFEPQVVEIPILKAEGLSFGPKGLFVNAGANNWYGTAVPSREKSLTKVDLSFADKPIIYIISQRPHLSEFPIPIYWGVNF